MNILKTLATFGILIALMPWAYWKSYKLMREAEQDGRLPTESRCRD